MANTLDLTVDQGTTLAFELVVTTLDDSGNLVPFDFTGFTGLMTCTAPDNPPTKYQFGDRYVSFMDNKARVQIPYDATSSFLTRQRPPGMGTPTITVYGFQLDVFGPAGLVVRLVSGTITLVQSLNVDGTLQ